MASIQYTFKGKKYDLNIAPTATPTLLLEQISEQIQVPLSGLKVMFKGKVLKPNESEDTETIFVKHPTLTTGAKIFVLGTTEKDIT